MLPARELAELDRHLTTIDLPAGKVLAHPGEDIRRVYFPHSGIISFMVELAGGELVQTSMVGCDGLVGAPQAIDDKLSINKIIVQLPGTASVVDRDAMREAIQAGSILGKLCAAHEQFFVADVQQTAACNALHPVEARMCRWMLRMNDLVGPDMPLTQEYLAAMIGVQRSSVSTAAGRLQADGLITYNRGHVHIENVGRLNQLSCECHEAVEENYARLFGKHRPRPAETTLLRH